VSEEPTERPRPPSDEQLDEIFGRDLGTDELASRGDEQVREDWYRENHPPHHGS